jgi:hypothetical protein
MTAHCPCNSLMLGRSRTVALLAIWSGNITNRQGFVEDGGSDTKYCYRADSKKYSITLCTVIIILLELSYEIVVTRV